MLEPTDKLKSAAVKNLKAMQDELDGILARFQKRHNTKLNGHIRVGMQVLWLAHVPDASEMSLLGAFIQQIEESARKGVVSLDGSVENAGQEPDSITRSGDSAGN